MVLLLTGLAQMLVVLTRPHAAQSPKASMHLEPNTRPPYEKAMDRNEPGLIFLVSSQFSCAAPIDGVNSRSQRDVWVCNSDGYVGHMCLLSLQPDPIVTLNTPVPGCNSRILCICAVPAVQTLKR